ncbi:hypothetical protein B0181_09845 [Moraxella caviae]|uniref:Uncharacterized protein conserved in bacteria (DUF2057) n=1 Tax=Moraxella caviae TaxID=34060 RepID=A0A1S9ZW99_9GAMM|nr:DUF2057 family protein [Moraxella caviae]OOR87748.1 hypothetical protein B0181_09845 [Moraxella caviae]STZ10160.1 Uncharacterized protein conserved in bacteria (DUF2057) [Moraxella caviae]
MKIAKALLIAAALTGTSALADVTLLVDDNIKVTAINGQEIRHGALQPLQQKFTLTAGNHAITARYDRLFDLTRGDHDYLKSGNVTVTATLADNQTYQLVMPNQPNTYSAAKEYAKAPTLAIAQNGQILASESTVANNSGFLGSIGQSIGAMFGRDNAVHANQKAIAALNQAPAATTTTQTAAPVPAAQKDSLDGFMQLWLNASPEEREKIRQWVQK